MTLMNVQPNAVAAPWLAVLQGLAGAAPCAFWLANDSDALYRAREQMKADATQWRERYAEPMHAVFRAPYWLLHAYAHWCRAWVPLQEQWAADEYDEEFPYGMDFRRYLGAWMHSVGRPQLGMTDADIEAVHHMTGVAMLPHELLPVGFSEFRRPSAEPIRPPLDEVLSAVAHSKS